MFWQLAGSGQMYNIHQPEINIQQPEIKHIDIKSRHIYIRIMCTNSTTQSTVNVVRKTIHYWVPCNHNRNTVRAKNVTSCQSEVSSPIQMTVISAILARIKHSHAFCTVLDSGGRMCNVILKSSLTFYFQFQYEK